MNNTLAGTLAVLGGLAFIGLVYNLVTLLHWRAEKRRRKAGETRIAADIYEPFCMTRMRCRCPRQKGGKGTKVTLGCILREVGFSATGIIDNRPVALPLVSTMVFAGVLLLLALDPVMDDPLIWGNAIPEVWRVALPDWLRFLWLGLGIGSALALIYGAFFLPQKRLSRQWLVLHADGRLTARGADMPVFDPCEPYTVEEAIWSDHRGVLIRQNGHRLAVVINRLATVAHVVNTNIRVIAPSGAYAVGVGLEYEPVDRHLRKHFKVE